jgi:hypothetical protein
LNEYKYLFLSPTFGQKMLVMEPIFDEFSCTQIRWFLVDFRVLSRAHGFRDPKPESSDGS